MRSESAPYHFFSVGRYTPVKRLLVSNLLRRFTFRNYQSVFAVFTMAVLILAKEQHLVPFNLRTRDFERANNLNRVARVTTITQLVRSTLCTHSIPVVRAFSIDVVRLPV